MKPLYLEMTAFGCYAEKTVVPFEKLKDGLYLVTGDTGAGKTTIFDAIMFALYGVASGSARKPEMLHSDHVDKSVDTVVMLRFAQDGKEYTVQRKLSYKKRNGEYKWVQDALLNEPDRAPINKQKEVTQCCEALLDLNADQFRKIIMLAQGEFKEFLTADSKKKGDILGQLFDSSPYLWYQNLFVEARKQLEARRAGDRGRLDSLMTQTFELPPEREAADFTPDNSALLDNLRALTEEEAKTLKDCQRRRDDKQREVNRLSEQRGAAEHVNADLLELKNSQRRLEELEGQREEYKLRKEALERAEVALHRAQPAIVDYNRAEKQVEDTRGEIDQLKANIKAQEGEKDRTQAQVDADAPTVKKIEELGHTIKSLDDQMPRYHELAQKVKEQSEAAAAAKKAAQERDDKAEALQKADEALKQLKDELEALSTVDADVEKQKNARDQAEKRFAGVNGLTGDVETLSKTADALDEAEAELRKRTDTASAASEKHNAIYQRFIAGQAGLLADDLRHRLTEAGEAACPVCGTALCREHLPNLAALSADTPDSKAVDKARKEADKCEKSRAEQQTEVERIKTRQQEERERAEEHAREWLDDFTGWQQLLEGDYLRNAIADAKAKLDDAEAALEAAQAQRSKRDKLKKSQSKQEEARNKLDQEREAASVKAQDQTLKAEKLASEIGATKLPYADANAAQAARDDKDAEKTALDREVHDHIAARDRAKERYDTLLGKLRGKESDLTSQSEKAKKAYDTMRATLRETGFSGRIEVSAVLAPMGTKDDEREQWLKDEQEAQYKYNTDLKTTREQLGKLQEQTRGKVETDMDALDATITDAKKAHKDLQDECSKAEHQLDNHRKVLNGAEGILKKLASTKGAWDRLERLATLAEGPRGDGGRKSFERHVMGVVFREILDMANLRLDRISGGRYALEHNEDGAQHNNSSAGFEIAVVDHITGQRRDAKSLSGGEGFFTSLALALGLSDVVQSHAGGKQMDALFIDEGFGTLDDDVLSRAVEVLDQLTEGNRLVGIISHVDKLKESITQKIIVHNGKNGSTIDEPQLGT